MKQIAIILACILGATIALTAFFVFERKHESKFHCAINSSPLPKSQGWESIVQSDFYRVTSYGTRSFEIQSEKSLCTVWIEEKKVILSRARKQT